MINTLGFCLTILMLLAAPLAAGAATPPSSPPPPLPPLSEKTQACLECHATVTPGIVGDWKRSRMAQTTPARAMKQPALKRRISVAKGKLPAERLNVAVGCAECHTTSPASHPDTFEHEDYKVHSVVTPKDCAVCHPTEVTEFGGNLMSQAWTNFVKNPLYQDLASKINGVQTLKGHKLVLKNPTSADTAESCLYCHGTKVRVIGTETREVGDYGEMTFPKLSGWPNRGVGRNNPDGSLGSCTACHTRHQFAMHQARQPQTCAQCHKGPDVPASKVYEVSKHGNIYSALKGEWDFKAVPWTVGQDFTAPTCAACHISLVVDAEGAQIAKRSHKMADRLWVRILGLIYSHPHPKSPNTSIITNKDGMHLATALDGTPASEFLISPEEQARRKATMTKVCLACHSTKWVEGQFTRLQASIKSADQMVATATGILAQAWEEGIAQGPAQGGSPFDEYIEALWIQQWLFYGNSVRFASAMMGADMGVFENGRWFTAKTVREMKALVDLHKK